MIQIAIDPSMLSKKPVNSDCDLAVTISGCSLKDIPVGWSKDNIRTTLYPWQWKEPPLKLRLYWVINGAIPGSFIDIDITTPDLPGYSNDKEHLRKVHERSLDKKLFADDGSFRKTEIVWDHANAVKEIKITDAVPDPNVNTGFLKGAIAQMAQKLSPVNSRLNLVFFAQKKDVSIVAGATGFVVFFINDIPTSGWYPVGIPELTVATQQASLKYQDVDGVPTTVYCPVTPIPQPHIDEHPIKLRDKVEGNFLGHVDISVSDTEDIVPDLLNTSGAFFELPRLIFSYIYTNKASLQYTGTDAVGYKKWIDQINACIWSVIRDASGFGYMEETDGNSIGERVVKQYCNNFFKDEVQNLSFEDQLKYWVKYWPKYNNTITALRNLLTANDTEISYSADKWIALLQQKEGLPLKVGDLIDKLKTGPADGIPDNIDKWLISWKEFLGYLQSDHELQNHILYLQWKDLRLDVAGIDLPYIGISNEKDKATWLNNIFSNAGDHRLLQKEALSVKYKELLLRSIKGQEAEKIAADCIEAIKKYAKDRIDPTQKLFHPFTSTPFSNPPADLNTPPNWNAFLDSVNDAKKDIENEIGKKIEKRRGNPPSLQISVDRFEKPASTADDDLNDEIAGHIVLMRRADNIFDNGSFEKNKEWRYLNWAKVSSVVTGAVVDPPPPGDFENRYVIPAFLPETKGVRQPFLELSNEKMSFIAGHKTFDDSEEQVRDDDKDRNYLLYNFDDTHSAYALWYGYHYQFAGFIALNSGVLPALLRAGSNWNVALNKVEKLDGALIEPYAHCRRVPVSAVRVTPTGSRGIQSPPKGLQPLAFELPEWKGNKLARQNPDIPEDDNDLQKNDQSYFLLANNTSGGFVQNEIKLVIQKPTTPYWNWYAWLGEEANTMIKLRDETCHVLKDPMGKDIEIPLAVRGLEIDLRRRDLAMKQMQDSDAGHLCDPAVSDSVVVFVESVFPVKKRIGELSISLEYTPKNCGDEEDAMKYLKDIAKELKVMVGNDTRIIPADNTIQVGEGDVVRIHIHSLIAKKHFKDGTNKFHTWMKKDLQEYNDSFLSSPVEIWFEAAKKPLLLPEALWTSLKVKQEKDKVMAAIEKNSDNYIQLAYMSRLEVKHQVWNWNGRIDESRLLLGGTQIDPGKEGEKYKTTEAMKWEAWSFSDRPDFSALFQETTLLAARPSAGDISSQTVHTDTRPGEEKALYYRYSVTAYSRYELLLGNYKLSGINSEIVIEDNDDRNAKVKSVWRRYLRRATKSRQLPKPAIRFVIPLTKSIKESQETQNITSASLLVVLEDRWFAEAGLAEQLELGIDLLPHPAGDSTSVAYYLNAGNDPILTPEALAPVPIVEPTDEKVSYPYIEKNGQRNIAVFEPKGPVGLTFDFAAQTPKLNGCAFVVEVPDINALPGDAKKEANGLKPWSLVQIAVRRVLRSDLCENGIAARSLRSEWTGREWVQFLPSIDSFIPGGWRKEVAIKGFIALQCDVTRTIIQTPDISIPKFDDVFEERMQRFLVLTEKVYDIGGQPCEKYFATYLIDTKSNQPRHNLDHPKGPAKVFSANQEGYARILLVRNADDEVPLTDEQKNENIWERLFGSSAKKDAPGFQTVQKDPTAALPIVSERLPYKIM